MVVDVVCYVDYGLVVVGHCDGFLFLGWGFVGLGGSIYIHGSWEIGTEYMNVSEVVIHV